jgi:hypothetical protein
MEVYTFDKNELQKLQKDLLENPSKYEEMLVQDAVVEESPYDDPGRFKEYLDRREVTREYWYNYHNDGRLQPEENWPMRVEYWRYKHWAEQIKHKSLNTLKYTVQRLLLDFESDDLVNNKTLTFMKDHRETKRQGLQRLLTHLNERTATTNEKG